MTVTAVPDLGYHFGAWTGDCSGTNPCTLTMDGVKSVSATFVQDEYGLTITQATGGTISATPAGPYHLNDTVTVTAVPDLGYHFGAWTGDCSGTNPCTLTMDGVKSVSATFVQDEYGLTITQATGGTISATPAGPYHLNDTVTVTAVPDLGYHFGAWTGDCSGTNPCTLTMDGVKSVSATFVQDEYGLTITQATGGTISATPAGPYHLNDTVTVTAVPDLGYHFGAWTGDCSGTNPCTLTMDGVKSVSATFVQDEYGLTITQATGGTISATPAGPYHLNDTVTVTAVPDLGYHFGAWTGDCSGTNPCTLTMDGVKSVSATFVQDEYGLTITQATGGTISATPAGPYHLNDTVTVTAVPDLGYHFGAWTGDCSGTNPCTLTMDGVKSVSATFVQDEYGLTITQATGGTISATPAGPYHLNDTVTVTAVPDLGYHFGAWTGDCSGTNPCTLTMDGVKSVSATFVQDEYGLTITQATGGTISATPAGPYHLNDTVTVTAVPDLGYHFGAWTGDCSGTNPCTLTMDGVKSVSATFVQDEYGLTITQATGGTISATPAGPYHLNDTVTVTAVPDLGYHFGAWTGDCSGTNPCTLTMDGVKSVSATFVQDEYGLTITQATGGTISATPAGPYHLNDTVTVTAVPDLGYHFGAWTGDCSGTNPCTLTMDGVKSVSATFVQDEYGLTITQATGGTISATPAGPYHLNDTVTVTAVPDLGYHFGAWTGDCSGTNPCTLTMDGVKSVSATFVQDEYGLTITQATGGTISATPAGPYHLNDTVTVTAVPDLGYHFGAWTGDCSGTNPCTLTMDGVKSVSATFVQDEYGLTITQATGGTISATPAGPYHLNDTVTVTAVPDLGYHFGAWTGDCSGTNPCTLTMDGVKSVSATFVQDEYGLTITQATGGTISATPAGPYHLNDTVTVTAVPDLGYHFGAWTGDCSGTNPCTLTMDGVKSVSATFVQDEYGLTITQATGGTISATPAGPYHLNDTVTVTAVPDLGYHFGAWTGDCSGTNPCTLTMDGVKSVSATFVQDEYGLTITQATGGTISATPAGPYHLNDTVTVTAVPDLGYHFGAWTGDCSGTNPCTLTMDGVKSVSATFVQDEYGLTITQATGGTISATPAGPYHLNDTVTVTAVPDLGYHFGAWTGDCSGTNPCTLTMDGVKSVSATFVQDEYGLTITQATGGTISATPAGPYHLNDTVTVTAVPDLGYHFGAWTGDCSGTNPCTLTMDGVEECLGDVRPGRVRVDDHAGHRRDDQRHTGGTLPPE